MEGSSHAVGSASGCASGCQDDTAPTRLLAAAASSLPAANEAVRLLAWRATMNDLLRRALHAQTAGEEPARHGTPPHGAHDRRATFGTLLCGVLESSALPHAPPMQDARSALGASGDLGARGAGPDAPADALRAWWPDLFVWLGAHPAHAHVLDRVLRRAVRARLPLRHPCIASLLRSVRASATKRRIRHGSASLELTARGGQCNCSPHTTSLPRATAFTTV